MVTGMVMIVLVDLFLAPFGLIIFGVTFLALKLRERRPHGNPGKVLLILSTSGYESVKERGTEHLASLDNDFFEQIFFLNPGSSANHEIAISPRLKLVDMAYPAALKKLRQMGFRYFSFALGQAYSLSHICKFIKEKRVSVIRSMEPHVMGFKGILLKSILPVKHVQDVRANFDLIYLGSDKSVWMPVSFPSFLHKISRKLEKALEGFVYGHSDYVFGGSKNNLDYAIYCGAPLDRASVVRVNIQPDLFEDLSTRKSIRETLGVEGKIILYCGRLSAEKYPGDAVTGFKALAGRRKDAFLLMVGDGPERIDLERFVQENGLQKSVWFLGHKSNQFLKDLFVSVDMIVCPLAGSVLVEAALAGLPIIAYDFEWHSELIVDNYSGILVDFRDIPALSQAMEFILDHPQKGRQYGLRAREIGRSLFLPDNIIAKEKEIYSKVIKKYSPPPHFVEGPFRRC